jgi:hypothetical protein
MQEVEGLARLTIAELRARFAELFGEPLPRTGNRAWLMRRIAWRLQALEEGGLSDRARARAAELACEADLRHLPPRVATRRPTAAATAPPPSLDPRLPAPGTVLQRVYKGRRVEVLVRPDGFEYAGQVYGSLSAAAKAITGQHCNGFLFFGLRGRGGKQ